MAEIKKGYDRQTIIYFVVILLIVIIWLVPILWMVNISFKSRPDILARTPKIVGFEPTWFNYIDLFGPKYHFLRNLINSIIIAVFSTLIGTVFASFAAYAIARFEFKGKIDLAFFILSQRMLPPIAILLPFYVMFKRFNLIGTYTGMIIAYLPITIPFACWLLVGFLRAYAKELDEAALLDGCSYLGVFRRIVVPMAKANLVVTGLFVFIFAWNEFLLALILAGSSARTIPVQLAVMVVPYEMPYGAIAAGAIVSMIPLVMVVYFLQKYIVTGLTMGAVREIR